MNLPAHNHNPMLHALKQNDADQMQKLMRQQPARVHTFLNWPQPWGDEQWMPLHVAAFLNHTRLITRLLEHNASVDCRTRHPQPTHARATPLHLAAMQGHLKAVNLLLEHRASLDVRDADQLSPLGRAAQAAHPHVVHALIQAGSNLELADEQQQTPLHLAIEADAPTANETALALINAGANPNATCPNQRHAFTPLHRCVSLGLTRLPVARALIQAGSDLAAFDPFHQLTALQLAQKIHEASQSDLSDYLNLLEKSD